MHYSYLMQEPSEFVNPRQRDKKRLDSKYTFLKFLRRTSRPLLGIPEIKIDWGNSVKRFLKTENFLLIQKYFEFGGVKFKFSGNVLFLV